MKKQFRLGVIGCDADSVSLLRGVVLSDLIREKKIIVSDESEDELDKLHYLGVKTTFDNAFVARNSDFLIISCSLKQFAGIAQSLEGVRPEKVISLVPSLTKSDVKNALGVGLIKVARCVMNTCCSIGSGAIAIDMTDFNKSTDDTDFISNIFLTTGTVVSIDESKIDAASALGGNLVFPLMLIDALVSAGVKQGLTKSEAEILAAQTISGASELVQRGENTVEELLMSSCKNGNPSIEIVKTLSEGNFSKLVENAVADYVKGLNGNK